MSREGVGDRQVTTALHQKTAYLLALYDLFLVGRVSAGGLSGRQEELYKNVSVLWCDVYFHRRVGYNTASRYVTRGDGDMGREKDG